MSGITHSINRTREGDTVKVTIFGVPARHTRKRHAMAEDSAYGALTRDEVKAMSRREKHFRVEYVGQAFETFTFVVKEVRP
jgi:hypothetical protein